MSTVKLAIVYYSTYGTNHQMAGVAAEAARAAGAEVRLRRVRETAPQAVVDSQPASRARPSCARRSQAPSACGCRQYRSSTRRWRA